ncbi:uncharacterized protein EAF02_003144 [Botrytis sinoallii]|uniref:uncharacterized protein n=1 Tax=Botrytis sinoallii TaxID=1463999 RepID=UPI0019022FEA|nr:uncharacterized protein EAF02_003144 [Botrytis sinoallii]KAF7888603.1 hypothetical protein EAF02_003144 [Botrytis sinoallii]
MAVKFAEQNRREQNRTRSDERLKRWRRGTRLLDFSFEFESEFDDIDIEFLLVDLWESWMGIGW